MRDISEVALGEYSSLSVDPDGLLSIDYTDNFNIILLFYDRLIYLIEMQRLIELGGKQNEKKTKKCKDNNKDIIYNEYLKGGEE